MDKEQQNGLEMLSDRLQMEPGTAVPPGRRAPTDAEVPEVRHLPDLDAVRAWVKLQWDLLRAAGLLR